MNGGPPLAAILKAGRPFGSKVTEQVERAFAKIGEIERSKVSPTIIQCIEDVAQAFCQLDDFKRDYVRDFYLALVLKTLLFVEHRLDATPAQDPAGAYLFGNPDGIVPLEKQLQQDYLRFLRSSKLGTNDEVRGIGAGRADVAHEYDGVRLVTEVKRELEDSSFESLLANYGEQTALYQTTNVRLGMLLVLDLTDRARAGAHLSSLYHATTKDLTTDGTTRGVLIIRLPANRALPSDATVAAKKVVRDLARKQMRRPNAGTPTISSR